jgi:hypothetical protein
MLALGAGECKPDSGPEAAHPLAHVQPWRLGPGVETLAHEGCVALEVNDWDEGVGPPGDLQHGGVDRGTGVEEGGREPPSSLELPPGRPGRTDQIDGWALVHAGAMPSDLPLDDEVRSHQPSARMVEEPVQDRRGPGEGRVCHDAVRRGRQRHIAHVGVQHNDIRRIGELGRQSPRQRGVELDSENRRGGSGKRLGQNAGARAEVDHPIATLYARVGDEPGRELRATEKVLTEPARPIGRRTPGHGTS